MLQEPVEIHFGKDSDIELFDVVVRAALHDNCCISSEGASFTILRQNIGAVRALLAKNGATLEPRSDGNFFVKEGVPEKQTTEPRVKRKRKRPVPESVDLAAGSLSNERTSKAQSVPTSSDPHDWNALLAKEGLGVIEKGGRVFPDHVTEALRREHALDKRTGQVKPKKNPDE